VYGISIYDISAGEGVTGTNNLTWTDDDALAMQAMLGAKGWSVTAGIANTQTASESQDATRLAIETDIANLKGTTGLVLFYYSGHGFDNIGGETAICPYGSLEKTINGYYIIDENTITMTELHAMFEAAGLSNVIIILDSCFSGGFVEEGATVDAVPPVFGTYDPVGPTKPEGLIAYTWFLDALGDSIRGYLSYSASATYITLSAAGSREASWEDSAYGHGIFTYALLLAAQNSSSDRDGDGYVTTSELYSYATIAISSLWNKYMQKVDSPTKDGQYDDYHPHLSGNPREYALWAVD
jgi:uncharacterized caspase-like protein